jgi:Flp pilus assembly protein TadG
MSGQSSTRQRGVAAVEFAILVPLLLILLTAPLYIGRVLWHYTVIHKAAHDAAR